MWKLKPKIKSSKQISPLYVIGLDGGGTKTEAVLANEDGEIIKRSFSGPSNFRNIGFQRSINNISQALAGILGSRKGIKVAASCLALPSLSEEYKGFEKKIKSALLKIKDLRPIFVSPVNIVSDQIEALRSVTSKNYGVVLIAGTGSVIHGWNQEKESKVSGWGYLNDEGSAFWIGEESFRAILKYLDGRGAKTLMAKFAFQKLRAKNLKEFLTNIYSQDIIRVVSLIAEVTDQAAESGDETARQIIVKGAKELLLGLRTVIQKLDFQDSFPAVLTGSMFKSRLFLENVEQRIRNDFPLGSVKLVSQPIQGSVNIAIARAKNNYVD